jgi:(2S)-methylsuccinyl-CoA dehydrogenase
MATSLAQLADRASPAEVTAESMTAAATVLARATDAVRAVVAPDGGATADRLEREQHAVHGLAWLATYVEALRQIREWALRLEGLGRLGELEQLVLRAAFGEYLARIAGGIPMSQGEIARLHQLHLEPSAIAAFTDHPAVRGMIEAGTAAPLRARLAALIGDGAFGERQFGDWGLEDDTLDMVREQFRRFAEEQIVPRAQDWHRQDVLIPLGVIEALSELGVFGLTVPEAWGGLGMGKTAMCVVTEELSRGYIGVGSLGTRSEIAAELIRLAGTDAQKTRYLPGIASGAIIPTAVFTEPDTGSDLASLQTRAVLEGDGYRLTGSKTWITHAARADLMTILCRTDPKEPGHRGLSILLAEKPRGSAAEPFPAPGLSGSEIPVLGYRGMKEYALSFDGFAVAQDGLLGGIPGHGFKQLMATFESARIQTAARAVGVARSALELGLGYARQRTQFGKPIFAFPRVADKLVGMAVEIMVARQLTLFAARQKDAERRCDLEAGMAKLLGAQVAWSAADNAVQIHGGNGYALEYPISRVFCDARILNIFEGAAEIQAQIIGRRLLGA